MKKKDPTRTVNVTGELNVTGKLNVTEVGGEEKNSSASDYLLIEIKKLLGKMKPDIKKWYHDLWLFLCLLIYLFAIGYYIINEITKHIYCTVNKVEAQGQVIATINNNTELCFLMLFLLAIIAIVCPLLFLIYSNNKSKGQEDYAIANNESYFKMVHHIINVVSDMEIRAQQKELQNPQPCITEESLKAILDKCLEEQRRKFEDSSHKLSEKITNLSGNMGQLSQHVKDLDRKLPLDATLIKIEQVVELVKALSDNGTAKSKNTFQADKIIVEDSL